jgi:peptidyl-prolyl cis-trans isomerase-like 4
MNAYHWTLVERIEHNYAVDFAPVGGPAAVSLRTSSSSSSETTEDAYRLGRSVWGAVESDERLRNRYFESEIDGQTKPDRAGLLAMAVAACDSDTGQGVCGSRFLITLGSAPSLATRAAVFGEVAEGMDVLLKLNELLTDSEGRPYIDTVIRRALVLDDPFTADDNGKSMPPSVFSIVHQFDKSSFIRVINAVEHLATRCTSPEMPPELRHSTRLKADEKVEEAADPEEAERMRRELEARGNALALEMLGDLPSADVRPPENVLFVCKLNPVTRSEDLRIIFSRFGAIIACDVIRDPVTNDSLSYAFIEFEDRSACEAAYFKMNNVLIDDRRIHVDFSQSVARLRGVWHRIATKNSSTKSDCNREKPKSTYGGAGGFQDLAQRTQYRSDRQYSESRRRDERYPLLFEHSDSKNKNRSRYGSNRNNSSDETNYDKNSRKRHRH